MKNKQTSLVPLAGLETCIHTLRGERVMFDFDLARLYGVQTKRLNEQVKRNAERFPEDFMFRLTRSEVDGLNWSQIATSSSKHRDPRFPPFAFTEHGALMAASVLDSPRAVEASLYVVRAFVRLRGLLSVHKDLARKLQALERKLTSHDRAIADIITTIRQMMMVPEAKKAPIGFVRPKDG